MKGKFDPSNLLGFLSAIIMLAIVILSRGSISVFISLPSVLIVLTGTVASTLNAHSISSILNTIKTMVIFFTKGSSYDYILVMEQIIKATEIIRREGPLALEKQKYSYPFLMKGITHIIDGTKKETLINILEIENASLMERHQDGQDVLSTMGTFAPAWGLIGTIIGLIFMLLTLDDPSNIGPAMATALLTTFYGAVLANLVFLPAVTKFENFSNEELKFRRYIIEGVMSVANSENPRIIRDKLFAYLDPKERAKTLRRLKKLNVSVKGSKKSDEAKDTNPVIDISGLKDIKSRRDL